MQEQCMMLHICLLCEVSEEVAPQILSLNGAEIEQADVHHIFIHRLLREVASRARGVWSGLTADGGLNHPCRLASCMKRLMKATVCCLVDFNRPSMDCLHAVAGCSSVGHWT